MDKRYINYRKQKRRDLKLKKRLKQAGILLSVVLMVAIGAASFPFIGRITPGVRYQNIRLGFLTPKEAEAKILKNKEAFLNQPIILTRGERRVAIPAVRLGMSLSPKNAAKQAFKTEKEKSFLNRLLHLFSAKKVVGAVAVDVSTLNRALEGLNGELYEAARPAAVIFRDGKVEIQPAEVGEIVDAEAAYRALVHYNAAPVEIKTHSTSPSLSENELAGINGKLSEATTTYDVSDKNRAVNVQRGANFFKRVVLQPGERLSFLETIGGITKDNGFAEGETISNGIETSGIGGGVCQVSTTMYQAVEKANLNILTKHNHSKPVDYAKEGTDCAVSDGYKDFIFTNPYNHPIYIETKTEGGTLTCTIFGAKEDKPFDIDLVTEKTTDLPAGIEREVTRELKPSEEKVVREKSDGSIYKTYKVFKENGREVRRELCATSRYVPVDGKILVGKPK